jgi:hypothetical protein
MSNFVGLNMIFIKKLDMKLQQWFIAVAVMAALNSCVVLKPTIPTLPDVSYKPEKKESVLNLPVKVDFNTVERIVNEKVPINLFSQKDINVGNGVKLQLEVVREGAITFSTSYGNIITSLPIYVKGKVTMNNEVKVGLFGFVNKAVNVSKTQDFETKINVTATTRLRIDQDWNIKPTTTSDFTITQPPKVNIMGFTISLGTITKQKLREQLPRLNSLIDEKIASSFDLHDQMTKYWESIRKPVLLTSTPVKVWGLFEPTQFNFAPPRSLNAKTIQFNLSVKTYIQSYIGENAPQPNCGPLLPLKNNSTKAENFNLNLPIAVEINQIKQIAEKEVVGKTFAIPNSSRTVTVNGIDVYGSGNKLVIKCNVKSKRIVGDIYLIGIPQYDKEKREIYMQDVDFDVNTNNLLAKKAAWLANAFFLKKIESKLHYSAGASLDEAKTKLESTLNNLKVDEHVKISSKVNALTIDSIHTAQDVIYMNANVSGNLNVSINTDPSN